MYTGHVDLVNRAQVSGWALNEQDPDAPVEVEVLLNGASLGRIVANLPRPDLREKGRFGNGQRGFRFEFPEPLAAGDDHEVLVRLGGTARQPGRGHILVKASPTPETATLNAEVVFAPQQDPEGTPSPRYVIHVGPHKTGTKFLQKGLFESRAALFEQGVTYPPGWMDRQNHSHFPLTRALASDSADLADGFRRLNDSPFRCVVLSSEDFVDLSAQALARLRAQIGERPVSVVFYCRRWSELLPSAWQETVKQGGSTPLPTFLTGHLSNPTGSTVVNYDHALRKLTDVFGLGSLNLVSYSNLVDQGVDMFSHFLTTFCGVPNPPEVRRERENISIDATQSELARVMNVLEEQARDTSSPQMFERLAARRADLDLDGVERAMKDAQATIAVSDSSPGLRLLHELLFERYGERLVAPRSGFNLFASGVNTLTYMKSDYMLAEGVANALRRAHAALDAG